MKYDEAIEIYVIEEIKYMYPSEIFCPSDIMDFEISP